MMFMIHGINDTILSVEDITILHGVNVNVMIGKRFKSLFFTCYRQYADNLPHMKLFVIPIQLLILITNIPMLISTLKYSLTMLDSLLVVSCINRFSHRLLLTIFLVELSCTLG